MATTIGKYIRKALHDATELKDAISDRIYPVTCPDIDNTPAPYIIYWVDSITESYSKDGSEYDTAQVSVMVVASDYDQKMALLPMVRKAMSDGFVNWNEEPDREFRIDDQTMTMGADEFDLEFGYHTTTFSYTIDTE